MISILSLLVGFIYASSKFPTNFKGATETAMQDVFMVELENGNETDCIEYVKSFLAEKGVEDERIGLRTNFNLKEYGNFCSFSVSRHTDEIFEINGAQISAVHNVNRAYPEINAKLIRSDVVESIHNLTGIDRARSELGLTGEGIKVAVIDTGIDYNHPALGNGFGPGKKVSFGWDLVGDDYGAPGKLPKPDPDPFDSCMSLHGTHVAGIIAADTQDIEDIQFTPIVKFTGAAPGAQIGAYRVFGCGGDNTGDDIIAAAILKAASDGAHIINLSIGAFPTFSDGMVSLAIEKVSKYGHIVVAAIGNDGDTGAFSANSPATSKMAFGVGSADNAELLSPYIQIDNEKFTVNVGTENSAFAENMDLSNLIVANPEAESRDLQSDGLLPFESNFEGKPVLIRWGVPIGNSRRRCSNIAASNGTACIIYGNTNEMFSIQGSREIPSAFISREAGLLIIDKLSNNQSPKIIIQSQKLIRFSSLRGGQMSSFSSWGLDQELNIKPDILAIGGNVLSTTTSKLQGKNPYESWSGTSMAAPNLAGGLALILEYFGKSINFDNMRIMVQNGAKPLRDSRSKLLVSAALQGAGLVDIYSAIKLQTRVVPSMIALNDTVNIPKAITITIFNDANMTIEYSLSTANSVTLNPILNGDDSIQPSSNTGYSELAATVEFSESIFSIKSNKSKQIEIYFTPPKSPELYPIYSGYLLVASSVTENVIHVPYAGVVGSYNEKSVFIKESPGFNQIMNVNSTGIYDLDFQPKKVLDGDEGILVAVIIGTTSRNVQLDIENAGVPEQQLIELGLNPQNLPSPILYDSFSSEIGILRGLTPRNSWINSSNIHAPLKYFWKGEVRLKSSPTQKVQLPAGKYRFMFYGLKPFGETPNGGQIEGTSKTSFDIIEREFELIYSSTNGGGNRLATNTTSSSTLYSSTIDYNIGNDPSTVLHGRKTKSRKTSISYTVTKAYQSERHTSAVATVTNPIIDSESIIENESVTGMHSGASNSVCSIVLLVMVLNFGC